MPTEKGEDVKTTLGRVLGDNQISLTPSNSPVPSPPSTIDKELLSVIEKTSAVSPINIRRDAKPKPGARLPFRYRR